MPAHRRVFVAIVGVAVAATFLVVAVLAPVLDRGGFESKSTLEFAGHVRDRERGGAVAGAFVVVNITSFQATGFGNGETYCTHGSQVIRTDAHGDYHFALNWKDMGWTVPRDVGVSLKIYRPGLEPLRAFDEQPAYSARDVTSFDLVPDNRTRQERLGLLVRLLDRNCESTALGDTYLPFTRAVHDEAWRLVCLSDAKMSRQELLRAYLVMSLARSHYSARHLAMDRADMNAIRQWLKQRVPGFEDWSPDESDQRNRYEAVVDAETLRHFCAALAPNDRRFEASAQTFPARASSCSFHHQSPAAHSHQSLPCPRQTTRPMMPAPTKRTSQYRAR